MSGILEIKARISSVKGTQKITRAMYLISASKSKKAKMQLEKMRPFFHQAAVTMAEILAHKGEIESHYFSKITEAEGAEAAQVSEHTSNEELYVVLSGDKGMAGGYNHNLINLLKIQVKEKHKSTLWVAGLVGRMKIKKLGYETQVEFKYPVMNPSLARAREISDMVVEKYLSGDYSKVHLVYTAMITPMNLQPVSVQLLPLKPEDFLEKVTDVDLLGTIDYEPGAEEVFNAMVPSYLSAIIYCALVEAFASEQHARMYAMDNATKSADDMIIRLGLRYNRARQADITQAINEIVSGIPTE